MPTDIWSDLHLFLLLDPFAPQIGPRLAGSVRMLLQELFLLQFADLFVMRASCRWIAPGPGSGADEGSRCNHERRDRYNQVLARLANPVSTHLKVPPMTLLVIKTD